MCGFAGCINKSHLSKNELIDLASEMSVVLGHRGPDSNGMWIEENNNVAFSHARLSIQDLSVAGHQPMSSISGNFVIAFNGEIYNHLEIRKLLDSIDSVEITWEGHSDTETVLCAIDNWGIEKTLEVIEGMFAFSLWDKENEELILCRDRLGEKPLYYGKIGNSFIFGSELKALKKFPGFDGEISRDALREYVQFNYVPSPLSIYKEIYKLEAGYYAKIPLSTLEVKHFQYWAFKDVISSSKESALYDEENSIQLVESAIEGAIKSQMISDVPLGAFLSGGIDSSLIVSIMQKYSKNKIKTFTIGFEDKEYDESSHAAKVSNYLDTEHVKMMVNEDDVINVIKLLPMIYDEPFADSSQIPTYLVSKAAKKHVSVALSGDAGDEIFGGYNRYIWIPKLWRWIRFIPAPVRNISSKLIILININWWNKIFAKLHVNRPGEKIHKFAEAMINIKSAQELYFNLIRQWKNPDNLVKNLPKKNLNHSLFESEKFQIKANLSDSEKMMFFDSLSYLPDDILVKVDRAAMSLSLETRVPFLNREIIELAWRMESNTKIKNGTSKNPLRLILNKYLPNDLMNKPKTGFGIPIGDWLKGPLFEWADGLLDPVKIDDEGFFFSATIQKVWKEHLRGVTDHSSKLWCILMFQAWLQEEKTDNLN